MGDLQGGWRRAIMPGTVRRRKSPPRRLVQQNPLPTAPCEEYIPPLRLGLHVKSKTLKKQQERQLSNRIRRRTMGEAKDIVGSIPPKKSSCTEDKPDLPHKARRSQRSSDLAARTFARAERGGSGVLKDLSGITDQLDRAIEVKMIDLDNEPTQIAENHVKLGLLRGASALIRRAKAMLEDYGKDLGEDMDPDFDVEKEN